MPRCTFTSFADLEAEDDLDGKPRDLEEEFRQTVKSDPLRLTAMTGTLGLSEPDVKAKMSTMTQKQRKNFNRGAKAVIRQGDVIADCL